MKRLPIIVVLCQLCIYIGALLLGLSAQDAPPKPTPALPKPITVSAEVENKILKAERDLAEMIAIQLRAENQSRQAQADYNAAEAKKPAATKAVSDAIEAAWQESHLTKDSYTVDPASFTFAPKEKPAAKNDLGAKPK